MTLILYNNDGISLPLTFPCVNNLGWQRKKSGAQVDTNARDDILCMIYADNKMAELDILFTTRDIADNLWSLMPSEEENKRDSWKLTTRNHCLPCGGEGIEALTK